jgi:hypothetical protein
MLAASMLASALLACALAPAVAVASRSTAINWSTYHSSVVCGIVGAVPGTRLDPGSNAPLNRLWPGLQCSAQGIPRPRHGIGDPFVQLGQGRAGRARLVDESQDDLVSNAPFVTLAPGSMWQRDGISCTIAVASVRCVNGPRHGFALSPGRVHLF